MHIQIECKIPKVINETEDSVRSYLISSERLFDLSFLWGKNIGIFFSWKSKLPIPKQQENSALNLVNHIFTSVALFIRKTTKRTLFKIIMSLHNKGATLHNHS